jgi:hypothetical protein
MKARKSKIPVLMAKLIIKYSNQRISMEEHIELDKWVGSSEANVRIFEELTDDSSKNVFDAEQLIAETEDTVELWIIVGLVTRYLHNRLNAVQKEALEEWIKLSGKNKKIFEMLINCQLP